MSIEEINVNSFCINWLALYIHICSITQHFAFSSYEVMNLSALFDVILCFLTICIYKYSVCYHSHTCRWKMCAETSVNIRVMQNMQIQALHHPRSLLSTHGGLSLEYFKRCGPSTRNIDQSQLCIPQSLPAHSGVSTVTGMSALIRAKGCWSGHPGWLSSQASHYAASRSCLSLSRSCSLRGWIILNHRIRRARLSSRPMTGFEPHTECGFKGQMRYKRTHWSTANQCKIQKQEAGDKKCD